MRAVLTQAESLNQLFDEKAFSWTLAMEAMETVLPGGVQVTSIEPMRDKDGHITVHVRVVGPRDRSDDLVRNLEHSRRFLEPRIVGETAESTNGPLQRQGPSAPPIGSTSTCWPTTIRRRPKNALRMSALPRSPRAAATSPVRPAPPDANPRARPLLSRRQMAASPIPARPHPSRRRTARMQTPFTIPRLEVRNEHKRIFLALA
jgi:type IV pilus assembly protein PilN